jgi:acylphosphatase
VSQCKRFRVAGRVQGVFFRASTQQQARLLGVTGWVRNTEDGAVEILACGSAEQLEALSAWLWRGPPSARVSKVTSEADAQVPPEDFSVR